MIRRPPRSTLFPYPPLSRSSASSTACLQSSAVGPAAAASRPAQRPSTCAAYWNSHSSRSEEHTSELQSRLHLVCRLLLEKKKKNQPQSLSTTTTLRSASDVD